MQVKHGLARARADVEDGAVAMLDVALAGDLRCGEMAAANDFCVSGFGFFQIRKMPLRNNEHVGGRLRMDVLEGVNILIFMNLLGGNLAADDAAEKAIRIRHRCPLSQLLAERYNS